MNLEKNSNKIKGEQDKGTEHEDSDIDIVVITDDIKTDTFNEEVKLMIYMLYVVLFIETFFIFNGIYS